jgi:hypothetical protein
MEAARGAARKALEQILDAMHSINGAYRELTCRHIQKYFFEKKPKVKNPQPKKTGQPGVLRWRDPATLVGVAEILSERGAELKRFLKEPEPQARACSRASQTCCELGSQTAHLGRETSRVPTLVSNKQGGRRWQLAPE